MSTVIGICSTACGLALPTRTRRTSQRKTGGNVGSPAAAASAKASSMKANPVVLSRGQLEELLTRAI